MYPAATLEIESPETIENWRPLVQWLLAIPHVVVLYFLGIAGVVAWVVAWFTTVFTGRLSEEVAGWLAMIHRYQFRVTAYTGFMYEEYPPFDFTRTLEEPGGSPVSVSFEPQFEERDRLTCVLRIFWLIPIAIFSAIVYFAATILWIGAFFAVLFTGRWPEGLLDFVVKALRLNLRANTYGSFLTDQYPPFALE
ncbi:MAG: DUF4389 domain-containing protein [Acidimicrobiia bacterium]|nr:DUF4389 domain-containing protein [Acidimicrobiia bacterium]